MKKTKMLMKNYQFRNVLSRGKYYSGTYIDVCVKKNNTENNFLGIAVSVKSGKAVRRNRVKRLIRENYRIMESKLKTGYSMVFLWKKKQEIKNASFYNIRCDIEKIFDKADLIIKENV